MDNAVRVLVFTGSGRAFCAGDDISGQVAHWRTTHAADSPGHDLIIGTYEGLRHLSQTLNLAIRNCDKIAIAALNGVAIQTGMTMSMAHAISESPQNLPSWGARLCALGCCRMRAGNTSVCN